MLSVLIVASNGVLRTGYAKAHICLAKAPTGLMNGPTVIPYAAIILNELGFGKINE